MELPLRRWRLGMVLVTGLVYGAALAPAPAPAQEIDVTVATAVDWSRDTSWRDRDCTSESPPALYGCDAGEDGLPLGAWGDFGPSVAVEVGVGTRLQGFRVEARALHRPSMEFEGTSNFIGVPGEQPVRGTLSSTSLLAAGYLDLADLRRGRSRVAPYIGAGAGITRHRVKDMLFRFPGLGDVDRTELAGGTSNAFTWMATGGLLVAVADWATLEIGYRYTRLGEAETDPGDMHVVRTATNRDEMIFVDGTRVRIETHGFSAGLRIGL